MNLVRKAAAATMHAKYVWHMAACLATEVSGS